jgi:PAS domain S-box-containing protein
MQVNYNKINASPKLAVVALMFFVLAAIAFIGFDQFRRLTEARASCKHTVAAISTLHAVLAAAQDAETGQRGFLISGDENYLDCYESGVAHMRELLPKAKELIANSPEEVKKINALETTINAKFAELKQTIELRRTKGLAAATVILMNDTGKQYMDEIRMLIAQMIEREQALLNLHASEADNSSQAVFFGLFLISTLALIFQTITGLIALNGKKLAENNLRESMVKLQEQADLLELSSDAIILRDFDGTIRYWNEGAGVIYGYTKQQALGMKSHDLFKTEFPKSLSEMEEGILTKGGWIGELIHYTPDNQQIIVYSRQILKRDTNGNGVGVLEINTDITERKEIERRVSEFYSMVSHELRTPLTSIRGALSLMEGGRLGPLTPRAQHLTQIALAESERLIRLINDILDIRKVEAGKLLLTFEELLPSEIVDSTLQSLTNMAQKASIKLKSQIYTADKIDCDRDRISQVLTNLISNAIKFSPQDGEIVVYGERASRETIRFSVLDKGVGIAEDQLSKLFAPFQQLDSSDSRPKGGTGLGLAICKAIVEQHGGKIGVTSIIGKGSTFWFELPVKQHNRTNIRENVPAQHRDLLKDLLKEQTKANQTTNSSILATVSTRADG